MRPYVDEEKCVGCGMCQSDCPADPNVYDIQEKAKVVHPEACTGCKACVESCPVEAITLKE